MKLHLLIDSSITPNTSLDDIIFISNYNKVTGIEGDIRYLDNEISNASPEVKRTMYEVFSHLDFDYNKILNTAYVKFFLPLFMVIDNVKVVVQKENVEEIVLYEGGEEPFFISEGAEGEGIRKKYKTNWMVNAFISNLFSGQYKISWVKKKERIFYNWYRNRQNLITLLGTRILKRIITSKTEGDRLRNPKILTVITLALQKRNIESLISFIDSNSIIYLTYNPSLVNGHNVLMINELSARDLLSVFVSSKKLKHPKAIDIWGVSSISLMRELKYCKLKYDIYEKRLNNAVNTVSPSINTLMLSNTTAGFDMVSIHAVAKKHGLRHINMQYVAMGRVLYPNLDLADKYYLYSRKTYELYKKYSNTFHLYFPVKKITKPLDKISTIKYTIFTQPDRYAFDYIDYLKEILPKLSVLQKDIEVIIKPHYRQSDLKPFILFSNQYPFVRVASQNENVEHILNNTTIAMTMHSSVIFEAMMNQVPTIVYNPNDKYHEDVYNNDICYPEVNFVIEEPMQTIRLLDNIDKVIEQFKRRMILFTQDNRINTNIQSIIDL